MKSVEDIKLENEVSDLILDVATFFNEVTTSDLQGMAGARAIRIIELVRKAK